MNTIDMNDKQIKRNRIAAFLPEAFRIAKYKLSGKLARFAEDVAQEALFKALEKEDDSPEDMEHFDNWLRAIVNNKCTDTFRKKREELTDDGDMNNPVATGYCEESDAQERKETHKNLKRCIHKLPSRDKKVILLRDFFKCSGKETAAYLEIPQGNVNVYYQRAKKKLRALLIA